MQNRRCGITSSWQPVRHHEGRLASVKAILEERRGSGMPEELEFAGSTVGEKFCIALIMISSRLRWMTRPRELPSASNAPMPSLWLTRSFVGIPRQMEVSLAAPPTPRGLAMTPKFLREEAAQFRDMADRWTAKPQSRGCCRWRLITTLGPGLPMN